MPATPRATYGTSINVYDSQGVAKPVNLYFQKTATANTWDVYDKLDDPTAAPPVVAESWDNHLRQHRQNHRPRRNTSSHRAPAATQRQPQPPNPNNLPAFNVAVSLDNVSEGGSKFTVSNLSQGWLHHWRA